MNGKWNVDTTNSAVTIAETSASRKATVLVHNWGPASVNVSNQPLLLPGNSCLYCGDGSKPSIVVNLQAGSGDYAYGEFEVIE
jgi:hypothetical protein